MSDPTRHLPASILQRLGALLVDALLFACVVMLPATLISWWFGPDDFTYCEFQGRSESCSITPEALSYTRTVFFVLAALFVLVYSRTITNAGSAGKKATEIIVVDAATALPISYPRALGRTLLSIVSVVAFGLGMLVALTNRERRTAHDYVMGTRVISP